jgi:hypothetical protein
MVSKSTRWIAFSNDLAASALPTLFGNFPQKSSNSRLRETRGWVGGSEKGKRLFSLGGAGDVSLSGDGGEAGGREGAASCPRTFRGHSADAIIDLSRESRFRTRSRSRLSADNSSSRDAVESADATRPTSDAGVPAWTRSAISPATSVENIPIPQSRNRRESIAFGGERPHRGRAFPGACIASGNLAG